MSDCIFCKIIDGKIPGAKIYEDENIIGIKDIAPQAPLHFLFISKKHYQSLVDIPATEMGVMTQIFSALRTVAEREGIAQRGFRSIINTGVEGGQTVAHLHVHLLAEA